MTGLINELRFGRNPSGYTFECTPTELGMLMVNTLLLDKATTDCGLKPSQLLDSLRFAGRTVGVLYVQVELLEHGMKVRDAVPQLEKLAYSMGGDSDGLVYNHLSDDLLNTARRLRQTVAMATVRGAEHSHERQRSMSLPTLKCVGRSTPVKSIWWDEQNHSWNFGCYRIGTNKMARLIAVTLMRGEEWVEIGGVAVTVDYLYDMVRITGSFGGFVDNVDESFDPYAPPAVPAMKIVD